VAAIAKIATRNVADLLHKVAEVLHVEVVRV
jgi:hypothetical protein